MKPETSTDKDGPTTETKVEAEPPTRPPETGGNGKPVPLPVIDEEPRRNISDQPTDKGSAGFEPYAQAGAKTEIKVEAEPPPQPPETGGNEKPVPLPVIDEGPRRSISDQPTDKDSAGFEPYVQALAEFLTNPETEPPLTLSIEGEWGSGKSSFMQQLAKEVERRTHGEDDQDLKQSEAGRSTWAMRCNTWMHDQLKFAVGRPTRVMWFNAWRHDKLESLYSGFAIHFLEAVRSGTAWPRRIMGYWVLLINRFEWTAGGILVALRVGVLWAFFLSAAYYVAFHGVPAFHELFEIAEGKTI